MQVKKILGVALAAALVGSMATVAAVTVSAREAMDEGEGATYFQSHTIGIVGSMTGWGSDPDAPMTDDDGDGIYTGTITLDAGEYDFKVRADSDWADSWGEYEADYDRTFNSQTNCHVEVAEAGTALTVSLDTNGEDGNVWPVSYKLTAPEAEKEPSAYSIIGGMTDWSSDIPMYEEEPNVFVGKFTVEAGDYEFKVRKDAAWDLSWGVYEPDYDRTQNSQTNCSIHVDAKTTVTVVLDATGDDLELWPISYSYPAAGDDSELSSMVYVNVGKPHEPSAYSIIGGMTDWSSDIPMYEEEPNIFVGKFTVEAGEYEFKVRKDAAWDLSWGVYEPDYDRTQNSQTNCKISVTNKTTVTVTLDATGDDIELWPISYSYPAAGDDSDLASMVYVNVGKPKEEEPSTPAEESSKPAEESSKPAEEASQPEGPKGYKSVKTDYIFFDNSQTKWDVVYAYWWNSEYSPVTDKITGALYPAETDFVNDKGEAVHGQDFKGYYPGIKMTQIEGTDVWQVRVPVGATFVIFNSGVSDAEVREGKEAYQIADQIAGFDAEANAGQIFVIDTSEAPKKGRGVEKTKFRYQVGAYQDYDGDFIVEDFTEEPSQPSQQSQQPQQSTTPTPTPTPTPTTGDSTAPIAIAVVALAAAGVAVAFSKKKAQD